MKRLKDGQRHYIWQHEHWPQWSWHNDRLIEVLGRARLRQGKFLSKIKSMGFALSRDAQVEVLVEEAVKTASIEGQMFNRDSVRSSVAKKLGLPSGGLQRPDRHVDGLVDVLLDATRNFQKPLTVQRLKAWQASLFPTGYSNLSKIRTGSWRGPEPMQVVSGVPGREKVHYLAPPYQVLNAEIKQFLSWWKQSLGHTEGLLRAGVAHFYFVTLHPFEDGNGRIARALTDMALAQDERQAARYYSLSGQIMDERQSYYDILERCQKADMDITAWLLWFLGCFERSIQKSEKLLNQVLAKAVFWEEQRETLLSARQRKVVNRLLDAGEQGFVGGLNTRKYVAIAKTSRATAFREISDLVDKKILRSGAGKGRNVSYDLIWPDLAL